MADVPLYQQPAANPVQPTGPEPVAPTAVPGVMGATMAPGGGTPGTAANWQAPPPGTGVDLSGGMPQSAPAPQMPQNPVPDQTNQPGVPEPFDGQPASRGGPVKNALTRMMYGMGQAMLQHVGMPTDYDIQKTQFDQAMKARQVQVDQLQEARQQQAEQFKQTQITWTDPRTGHTYTGTAPVIGQIQRAAVGAQAKTDVADTQATTAQQKTAVTAAGLGYKIDPTTKQPVPRTYDDLSPQQQALYDYKQALTTAEPQKIQIALQKLRDSYALGSQRNAISAARLEQSLSGAPPDRLRRGDLANNAQHNIDYINDIMGANPDLFGKIAGRYTTIKEAMGSDDPAIREIAVSVHNLALASNGAHGLRSHQAVLDTENDILNHFRDSPQATAAGLGAMRGSLQTFVDDAKRGKGPSGGAAPNAAAPTHIYDPKNGKINKIGGK